MKLAICVAPMELGGLGDGFTINMSRLAALPRFSASFSTMLSRFYFYPTNGLVLGETQLGLCLLSQD
jgi:hypothetical protein